eukprot:CAMPEP_0174319924 /NCGR_PEP_ID=MMETSP0810-20121108/9199_1 /TAXON_ID=73025 ORGANISM="Eutreptiella gymnastica-like, Strain CCMP1594" /NCGR_SAMPLE_ID=MMETSP0810 /ASSEMBLY_ACC=CAM_ASM_000659 /LENGTH=641 /DNA_ID=CAMNT_0015430649 /DNA_START=55 /DNA_END=1980 /DNA_ORIENTATION=+
MSQIAVSIISGDDLKIPEGTEYIAPYVEIEYGEAKRTTNTVEDVNPVWNERFTFDVSEDEDEMTFNVFNTGGQFVGKALLSFSKFGYNADLCFELADLDNDVAGKLIVKVEPEDAAGVPEEVDDSAAVVAPPAAPAANVDRNAPKLRFALLEAEVYGATTFDCILKVGEQYKHCAVGGDEEYLFAVDAESDVTISIQMSTEEIGQANLKGSVLLPRVGTDFWIALSNSEGVTVGKVLLSISNYTPVGVLGTTLDSSGNETIDLTVEVVGIEGLPSPCDPCVYLSVGENDRVTTVKEATTDPVYEEKFEFFVAEVDTMSAKVFDKEEFIAEAIVPISELLYVASIQKQLEVKLLDRKRKDAGLLVLGAEVKNNLPTSALPKGTLLGLPAAYESSLPVSSLAGGSFIQPFERALPRAPITYGSRFSTYDRALPPRQILPPTVSSIGGFDSVSTLPPSVLPPRTGGAYPVTRSPTLLGGYPAQASSYVRPPSRVLGGSVLGGSVIPPQPSVMPTSRVLGGSVLGGSVIPPQPSVMPTMQRYGGRIASSGTFFTGESVIRAPSPSVLSPPSFRPTVYGPQSFGTFSSPLSPMYDNYDYGSYEDYPGTPVSPGFSPGMPGAPLRGPGSPARRTSKPARPGNRTAKA